MFQPIGPLIVQVLFPTTPAMLANVDTRSASAVSAAVKLLFAEMFPYATPDWLVPLFCDVDVFFSGRHPDYQASDLGYHDLEHTLQAALCFARLMAGRNRAGAAPAITLRQFEIGLAAVLLHDTGYLKLRFDLQGTGAKYTHTHVLRSCAFAASYLPRLGASLQDIQDVVAGIGCTGSQSEIGRLQFRAPLERTIGCCVATADYLAQMGAPDYPGELAVLFQEFQESDEYYNVAAEKRCFASVDQLVAKTPDFWRNIVRPKLENEFEGVYRFLSSPYPLGPNAYLDSIKENMAEIEAQILASARKKK